MSGWNCVAVSTPAGQARLPQAFCTLYPALPHTSTPQTPPLARGSFHHCLPGPLPKCMQNCSVTKKELPSSFAVRCNALASHTPTLKPLWLLSPRNPSLIPYHWLCVSKAPPGSPPGQEELPLPCSS